MLDPVRIKICGVTSVADARMVAEAGADYVGLNFHRESPRCVDRARAADIIAALPSSCLPVAVMVDRNPTEIIDLTSQLGVAVVQLHGNESPLEVRELQTTVWRWPGDPRRGAEFFGDESIENVREMQRVGLWAIKAFRLGESGDLVKMEEWLNDALLEDAWPQAVLFDSAVASQPGGTGRTIPGDVFERLVAAYGDQPTCTRRDPRGFHGFVLAGGLHHANVAERIRRLRPWMVDVASGVESAPGIKDAAKVAAFVAAARSA